MSDTVLLERNDRVAIITLNRPSVLNALNPEMAVAFGEAVSAAASDHTVRCVVIRGAGEQFMAGADLGYFRERLPALSNDADSVLAETFAHVHGAIRQITQMDKPVLASVRGTAAGIGVSLVLACDLAIASEDCLLRMAYNDIGTSPDGGATYHLPRTVGLRKAMELCLAGPTISAEEARTLGIINRVVPADRIHDATLELAAKLTHGAAPAQARTKALLRASLDASLAGQLDAEQEAFTRCAAGKDFAEGVTAFCEKRAPDFRKEDD